MSSSTFVLDAGADMAFKVHPSVVLNVLEHHTRRPKGASRVVGALLSSSTSGAVEITNSFPVALVEGADETSVKEEQLTALKALYSAADDSEVIVGWYSTGSQLDVASSQLHTVFSQHADHAPCVHLLVDTSLEAAALPVRAFTASPVAKLSDSSSAVLLDCFRETQLSMVCSESERIALDNMIKGRPVDSAVDGTTDLDAPCELTPSQLSLESSFAQLAENIETLCHFVQQVKAGKIKADPSVGRAIADALASFPRLDGAAFRAAVEEHAQDLLTIRYLAQLTKMQVVVADKSQAAMP